MKKIQSYGLVYLIVGALWGCNNTAKVAKPENLLTPEKLSDIQIDLQLSEARVYRHALPYELSMETFKRLQKEVFAKHKTDSATFYASYNYYMKTNTDLMEKIYQRTSDSLEAMQRKKQISDIEATNPDVLKPASVEQIKVVD